MTTYHFRVQRSYQFTYLFLLFYGLAYIVLCYLPLSLEIKSVALLVHTIQSYLIWQYQIQSQHPDAIVKLCYLQTTAQWYVCSRTGDESGAQLQPGSVCMYYLTVLHFKLMPSNQRTTLILFLDSLSAQESRQLRRLLWWKG